MHRSVSCVGQSGGARTYAEGEDLDVGVGVGEALLEDARRLLWRHGLGAHLVAHFEVLCDVLVARWDHGRRRLRDGRLERARLARRPEADHGARADAARRASGAQRTHHVTRAGRGGLPGRRACRATRPAGRARRRRANRVAAYGRPRGWRKRLAFDDDDLAKRCGRLLNCCASGSSRRPLSYLGVREILAASVAVVRACHRAVQCVVSP